MNAVVMDGRWTSEAAVNVMPDPTAVEGRVPPFAASGRRPDAHVCRDLAVSRVLTHNAMAWNELWDAFRSGRNQSLFTHSLGHQRAFKLPKIYSRRIGSTLAG
jgi:hypothetical protein